MSLTPDKQNVQAFWEEASCGEAYAVGETQLAQLREHARQRYALEPFIARFASFAEGSNRDVLEIGVGMGADHLEWAKSGPRRLIGVDLTERAIGWTRARMNAEGHVSELRVADAECLPFSDRTFDIVYSWGVLHHSPNTPAAIDEVFRVLRPGGTARVMVYHRYSVVGLLLWTRYALLTGRFRTSLSEIYSRYLESPGTKAYSPREARSLFSQFASVRTRVELSPGDLMTGVAGQRHGGPALNALRLLWPRSFVKCALRRAGLFLMVEATR